MMPRMTARNGAPRIVLDAAFAVLVLLAALVLLALAVPAAAQEEGTEGSEPTEFVPREICAGCHEQGDTFPEGAHGRAMAARGEDVLARSCVACHGPGEAHIEDPVPENIVRWPDDDACSSCHGDRRGRLALATPAHERNRVACLDCHDEGHVEDSDRVAESLLKDEPFELCSDCHQLQASSFFRPFAHRDGTEPFDCTACHSAHGTGRVGRLASFSRTGVCADCHEDKVGPFIFPHPPQPVDGCLACHQPHGSTNPRMLTRRTVLNLCLECHANVPAFHDLSQARFRNCQTCHSAVHGSNRDQSLFDE